MFHFREKHTIIWPNLCFYFAQKAPFRDNLVSPWRGLKMIFRKLELTIPSICREKPTILLLGSGNGVCACRIQQQRCTLNEQRGDCRHRMLHMAHFHFTLTRNEIDFGVGVMCCDTHYMQILRRIVWVACNQSRNSISDMYIALSNEHIYTLLCYL